MSCICQVKRIACIRHIFTRQQVLPLKTSDGGSSWSRALNTASNNFLFRHMRTKQLSSRIEINFPTSAFPVFSGAFLHTLTVLSFLYSPSLPLRSNLSTLPLPPPPPPPPKLLSIKTWTLTLKLICYGRLPTRRTYKPIKFCVAWVLNIIARSWTTT